MTLWADTPVGQAARIARRANAQPMWIALICCLCSGQVRADAGTVLIVTPYDVPAVRQVTEALRDRRTLDGRSLPPLRTELRVVPPEDVERDAARALRPELHRYKAVYSTTLFLARAIQMEDARIPIVFEGAADPLQLCLVDSLRRPGRNATGYMNTLPDEDTKLLEVLMSGFPQLKRVVYLVAGSNVHPASCDPEDIVWKKSERLPCQAGLHEPDATLRRLVPAHAVSAQAKALGVSVAFLVMCDEGDIARLPALMNGLPKDTQDIGFVIPWQGLFPEYAQELVDVIARMRRPAIYGRWLFARHGGILALEPHLDATDDRAPIQMLLQVLEGRSPATLPVQMPRGFKIMVNAKAAAAQGLQPAIGLLRRADEITVP